MRYFKVVFLFIVILSFGCSGGSGSDPITPDLDKTANVFSDAIEIFGPNTNGDDFTDTYHDIALAQIGTLVNDPGSGWSNNHGCFAVTLNRFDNDPAHSFKPVFR